MSGGCMGNVWGTSEGCLGDVFKTTLRHTLDIPHTSSRHSQDTSRISPDIPQTPPDITQTPPRQPPDTQTHSQKGLGHIFQKMYPLYDLSRVITPTVAKRTRL